MPETRFDNDAGAPFNTLKYIFLQKPCLLVQNPTCGLGDPLKAERRTCQSAVAGIV